MHAQSPDDLSGDLVPSVVSSTDETIQKSIINKTKTYLDESKRMVGFREVEGPRDEKYQADDDRRPSLRVVCRKKEKEVKILHSTMKAVQEGKKASTIRRLNKFKRRLNFPPSKSSSSNRKYCSASRPSYVSPMSSRIFLPILIMKPARNQNGCKTDPSRRHAAANQSSR